MRYEIIVESAENSFGAYVPDLLSCVAVAETGSIGFKALAESQAQTDERLNIFVNVVERYISRDNNGSAQNRGED